MSAREVILSRIRDNLGRDDGAGAAVEERLARHEAGLRPQRSQLPHAEQVDLFAAMAEEVDATVARVADTGSVPEAVAEYLTAHNLPARLVVAPDGRLDDVPWEDRPTLEIRRGAADETDATSVTPAFAGIAETGTVMATSGKETPTTLNFLPENHIVVLRESEVVGTYEDGWQRLRGRAAASGDTGTMPRTVNFITGPSRTADIAMTLYLGAHGPRRLHIILVADDGG
jgi:L-lactate dehydrogenase complex protein LldG